MDGLTLALIKATSGGGGGAVLESLYANINGDYYPPEGVDGFDEVHVDVEGGDAKLQEKTATENGVVLPDSGYDGLSKVTVDVPASEPIILSNFRLDQSTSDNPALQIRKGRIVTGFSTSLHVVPMKAQNPSQTLDVDWSGSWEIGCAFNYADDTVNQNFCIWGVGNSGSRYADIPVAEVMQQKLCFGISSVGNTTWDNWFDVANLDIAVGQWYFCSMSYDPSTKTVHYTCTSDFQNYYEIPDYVMANDPYYNSSKYLAFCGLLRSNNFILRKGQIDLYNTYIKVNGQIVWGMFTGEFPPST